MRRHRLLITSLSLMIVITFSLAPKSVSATDNGPDDERVIRLYATATTGPIGTISLFSSATVNNRSAFNEQYIWSGELVRASDRSVLLTMDSIGKVTLKRGSIARFSTVRAAADDSTSGQLLIASIITGELVVRLEDSAQAYVEAYGSSFTASRGSSFRISSVDGGPELETIKGEVSREQATERKYVIRPLARQGVELSVKARATRQIQFRVTDEHDRPVPDVPVVLLLNGSGGELSGGAVTGSTVTGTTNAQGVVTANFSAGATPATGSVTATVAGTSVSATVGVTTTAAAGIFAGTTLAVITSVVAAGAVATVVTVKKTGGNSDTTEPVQVLPPNITPKP
ncbi:MAG: hypothetical protein WBV94_27370 [Blastocatellia bacterium]